MLGLFLTELVGWSSHTLLLFARVCPEKKYVYVCPPWHCTLLGSLEHQAWPGPRGKSSLFLPDAVAFGCSAAALRERGAHLSPAALAAGVSAFALA